MKETPTKLLLVIPIRQHDDLEPVVESEGWYTVKDLFSKTQTSFNTHWNGNYVLDQDEIPWKASQEEVESLQKSNGKVIVLADGKYHISDATTLFNDTDGSVYVQEEDIKDLLA